MLNIEAVVFGIDIMPSSIKHEKYTHYLLDVTDEEQVASVINQVDETSGRIDELANCAGIFANSKPF
ncbi:SDR family oxidoreductase [Herbivorax sp. ANBcel31]|uniref:SDR family oxidoreductase n=1 Tax=Herbivorax sp. ANBcel31 TaxID=3069754 RepID=UPI0027B4FECA|nr:SDR family oxidoreductase [Herbivorax sp. ANBcel31]MDQ2087892.1 SDR family oxidoreductase [Herbivorax sp. ANBcel31]